MGVTYYKNGKKKAYGQWDVGYKFGIWRYFNENGVLIQKGEFNEYGYRDGEWLIRDSLGRNDSIFIYNYGYIDTVYAPDLDTFDIDTIDIKPFELKGDEGDNLEEDPLIQTQG